MALEPDLKQAVQRIAAAIGEFAKGRGLSPSDYKVYVRDNWNWGSIHVIVEGRGFEGADEFALYSEVKGALERAFTDDPQVVRSINLSVSGLGRSVASRFRSGTGYAEMHDYLVSGPPPSGMSSPSGIASNGW